MSEKAINHLTSNTIMIIIPTIYMAP